MEGLQRSALVSVAEDYDDLTREALIAEALAFSLCLSEAARFHGSLLQILAFRGSPCTSS